MSNQETIINYLKTINEASISDIQKNTNISYNEIPTLLHMLVVNGKVELVKRGIYKYSQNSNQLSMFK